MVEKSCQEVPGFAVGSLVQLGVFLGPVHGAEFMHVLLNVLLGLVFDVLVAFKVFRVLAGFQFLVHHPVSQLWVHTQTHKYRVRGIHLSRPIT